MNGVGIVFCRRRHPGSLLLRVALWSAWSHCALIDGEDIIEATAFHGVRRRPLLDLQRESSEYAIVQLPAQDPRAVLDAAASQIGKNYDWLGVFGIGARRKWQSDDSWFCSELIAWAFEAAGQPLVRVHAWRITPRDLYLPIWP